MQVSHQETVTIFTEQQDQEGKKLARLRRLALANYYAKEMHEDPSKEIPFTEEELRKRGLI